MRSAILTAVFFTVLSPWCLLSRGAERDGVVDEVNGRELTIKPEFHFLPGVGDKLKIIVTIPEVGDAVIGAAVVTKVDDTYVYARIEEATGKIQRGHIVRSVEAAAPDPPDVPDPPEVVSIEGWGTLSDPAGGATVVKKDGAVDLSVPGSYRDLWPEGKVNAPRLLQPVKGDFLVRVRVTSPVNVTGLELAPDGPAIARFPYRAAVLMVWHDENSFVRLERASSVSKPHRWGYQALEPGKEVIFHVGLVRPDGASYLAIQRKKGVFSAWYRQEGDEKWTATEAHRMALPDEVQVGVSLVNTTSKPFTVRFEDFVVK